MRENLAKLYLLLKTQGGELCSSDGSPRNPHTPRPKTAMQHPPAGVAARRMRLPSIREWIRTTNLRLRRPTLYPVELRGQNYRSINEAKNLLVFRAKASDRDYQLAR